MNKKTMMPRYYPNIYRCIQRLPWHCQSVLILWHFDCRLDFFNFSLRGTKIHPKKPAFLRPIKSFIFLKYMPRLHLLPSRISKYYGEDLDPPPTKRGYTPLSDSPPPLTPMALRYMSSLRLLPKILHLLKNFLRTLICSIHITETEHLYIYIIVPDKYLTTVVDHQWLSLHSLKPEINIYTNVNTMYNTS